MDGGLQENASGLNKQKNKLEKWIHMCRLIFEGEKNGKDRKDWCFIDK